MSLWNWENTLVSSAEGRHGRQPVQDHTQGTGCVLHSRSEVIMGQEGAGVEVYRVCVGVGGRGADPCGNPEESSRGGRATRPEYWTPSLASGKPDCPR